MAGKRKASNGRGSVRVLESGRWQARFTGPDDQRYPAPMTFDSRKYAEGWLQEQTRAVELGTWTPPNPEKSRPAKRPTLLDYSGRWLQSRRKPDGSPLKRSTVSLYRRLLDSYILPELGDYLIDEIRPDTVRDWNAALLPDGPTTRARAYTLLHSIMATAETDELIERTPCRVRGAGRSARAGETVILSDWSQVAGLTAAMPPDLAATVLLGVGGGLRIGEVLGLARRDVNLSAGTVTVRQTADEVRGQPIQLGTPKSRAGARTVVIPPHLTPMLAEHLDEHTDEAPDSLLFPARQDRSRPLPKTTFDRHWHRARSAIGRPDLRFHDLRHTAGTWAAQHGATLAETMAMLGHARPDVALRYQHATEQRAHDLARRLSETAESGNVVPLTRATPPRDTDERASGT